MTRLRHKFAFWNQSAALVQDALLSLTAKPIRTVGMVAGILLAVASTTTAILIADTQQFRVDVLFDLQRSSIVMIQAQNPPANGFSPEALAKISQLEPVGSVGELSIWVDNLPIAVNQYSDASGAPLIVADAGGLAAAGATVSGMDPKLIPIDAPLVWLGSTLFNRLGLREGSPETVVVNARTYSVAGIIDAGHGFGYLNTGIVVGRATAQKIVPAGRTIRVIIGVRPGSASAVAQYSMAVIDPSTELSLVNATPPDGQILLQNVSGDLRTIGLALGGFIGFVGLIAVANTMSMAVNQRSRELGLRSAMGWAPSRIRALILVESTIAGLVASIIGCTLGVAISLTWALVQSWQPIVLKQLPFIVIGLGTMASLIGGFIPAQRAGSISPMTAMRS